MTNGRSGIPRAGKWPQLEYSWSVVIQTLRPKESAPASKSSVPIVATLPLHRNAGGIPDLDPDRARTRPIGAIHPLRDNALGAKPAGVLEYGGTVLGNVFVERDTAPRCRGAVAPARPCDRETGDCADPQRRASVTLTKKLTREPVMKRPGVTREPVKGRQEQEPVRRTYLSLSRHTANHLGGGVPCWTHGVGQNITAT